MWSRIEGVAGKVRTNVSQLARDVLEGGEEDSPQQGAHVSTFSNGFQPSTVPYPPKQKPQPHFQAAGVDAAQQTAQWPLQATPVVHQHKPLQQIPFMPQHPRSTQPAVKPKLFVPQPVQAQQAASTAGPSKSTVPALPATATSVVPSNTHAATHRPAVSSRLSALKAKLDQDKHRSTEDKSPTRPAQHVALAPLATSNATRVGSKASTQPARPPIPFLSLNPPDQAQLPADAEVSQRLEASLLGEPVPSAQQLQDPGFVEVDLDSPDLPLVKTKPDQTPKPAKRSSLPIPFMQTGRQSQSSPPSGHSDSQTSLWGQPDSNQTGPLSLTANSPASPMFPPHVPPALSTHNDTANAYDSQAQSLPKDPAANLATSQAQMSTSAFAQVPFGMSGSGDEASHMQSGPPSIGSSAVSSPGAAPDSAATSRRSSFLPRGMSSHLHKALRATAAAASKASAAIAPPPSAQAGSSQLWQPESDAQTDSRAASMLEQTAQYATDQDHAASIAWEADGNAAAEQPGKDTPWWQKQLRNLHHNLQSTESEDGSLSQTNNYPGMGDASAEHQQSGNLGQQWQQPDSNGNLPDSNHLSPPAESNHQLPSLEIDASEHGGNLINSLYDEAAPWQQQSMQGAPLNRSDEHMQSVLKDEQEAGAQVSSESFSLFAAQPGAEPSAAPFTQSGTDLQQSPRSTSSPNDATQAGTTGAASKQVQAVNGRALSLPDTPATEAAHSIVITPPDTQHLLVMDAAKQSSSKEAANSTDSQGGQQADAEQSAELQNLVAQLRQDLSAVQQRLTDSHAECSQLKAMLAAQDDASETSAQTHAKLEQHLRLQSQQQQQRLEALQQQLTEQQGQFAQQASSSTASSKELKSSQQQVRSLQARLSEQAEQLEAAESAVQGLEKQLHVSQAQCEHGAAELGRFQRDMHTMKQQLGEHHKAQDQSKRAQQSAQAELQQAQAERDSLRRELSAAQQQAATSQQSLQDRDAAWQEELQQQQSHGDRLQQELDELKLMHEQQQAEQREAPQPGSPAASVHQQDELIAQLTDQLQQSRQDLASQRAKTMALQQALEDQGEEMEAAQASAVASAAASEDLHASLEAQLRSSQADIGRLQSEVSRLKAAAASADAQALADSPASTSSRAANSQARLEQQLQSSQAEVANLRREVDQLKTAAAHASGVLPADVRQSQEASTSGQSPGQTDLQQRMQAAELERDKAKQQLSRLKQQLMSEQEEEEEKVRWRVEAEVKLALQEALAAQAQQGLADQEEVSRLRQEVAAGAAQIQQMQQDLQAWEDAVTARDAELRNLQAALGELTFESEAAGGLRAELRAAQQEAASLQQQVQQSQQEVQDGQAAVRAAQQAAADASQGTHQHLRLERQLQDETAMLRRALKDSMGRLATLNDEGNVQVDRRIVVKLLVTFFEKGQSQEVLQLMARILNFTDEDKARIGLTGARRGIFGRVASRLSLTSSDTKQESDSSLADQWLDFLVQQAEAADAAEAAAKGAANSRSLGDVSEPAPTIQHNWNSMQNPIQSGTS